MTGAEANADQGWRDAIAAAAVFAVDPHAIGGILVCGARTPAAEHWLAFVAELAQSHGPWRKCPLNADDAALLGGLDLSASLAQRMPVSAPGLMARADGGVVVLPDAECASPTTMLALASALDSGVVAMERDGFSVRSSARFGVIALSCPDEGSDDRGVAPALRERLGIILHFGAGQRVSDPASPAQTFDISTARQRLQSIAANEHAMASLAAAAMALGIGSLRVPIQALYAARTSAALAGRSEIADEDLAFAARVILAPRATQWPADQQHDSDPPSDAADPAETPSEPQDDMQRDRSQHDEMLVAACLASMPADLLAKLQTAAEGRDSKGASGRSGAKQASPDHGRRLAARRGDLRRTAALDLLATLRAAVPWQRIRQRERTAAAGIDHAQRDRLMAERQLELRASDLRIKSFKAKRETTTIFVVDASGSAAAHRLGEAKGAIELLLAQCYARRDYAALIAFRNRGAEVLLPATRSLARVRKRVVSLPGGGGTPLAMATDAAAALAEAETRKGRTPTLVFFTDGKANIDRNGEASRGRAMADALAAARSAKSARRSALVIDTSPRPAAQSKEFAVQLGADYLPLPYARAQQLSTAIKSVQNRR